MGFLQLRSQHRPLSTLSLLVITNAATSITSSQADGNGKVIDAGGSTVTERGFVWSTSPNPTTADNKLIVAGTTGTFTGSMTGLLSTTVYYFRAYAIDQIGTEYGENQTFVTAAGGGSSIKTWNGLAMASVKTVNGLAVASVKTINGLTNV